MATTTNYGWETPDDTDLVKDGAAAIRTLGNSIDTTTKNLNPQTTTGALAYRSATANVNTALTIGSTGQVLTVAGGVPTWAAPAAASLTLAEIASGSLSGTSLTISSLTAYDTLILRIAGSSDDTESQDVLQINASSSSVYDYVVVTGLNYATFTNTAFAAAHTTTGTSFQMAAGDESITSSGNHYFVILTNCKAAGFTTAAWTSRTQRNDSGTNRGMNLSGQGIFKSAAAVSSITFKPSSSSTYDAGTYALYGA